MRHYLLVGDFSKWPPVNVVLRFYTFGEIEQMEKTALIQSPKHKQALMLN